LYYVGTLAPALGFFNLYFSRYSFVADHFQYLASTGLIALGAAAFSRWFGQHDVLAESVASLQTSQPARGVVVCVTLLLALTVLTWRQTGIYTDIETLWRATLATNPDCWMAQTSLGSHLLNTGRTDEALSHLQRAVDLRADGMTLDNLGSGLLAKGETPEAIAQFQRAVLIEPSYVSAHNNLGIALLRRGQRDEAAVHFQELATMRPDFAPAQNNLGTAMLQMGRIDAAAAAYQRALEIDPGFAEAGVNLARVAWLLATCPEASIRNGARAVDLAQRADRSTRGRNREVAHTLAAAYAETGRYDEAISTARRALAMVSPADTVAAELQAQLATYEARQPFHESEPCAGH